MARLAGIQPRGDMCGGMLAPMVGKLVGVVRGGVRAPRPPPHIQKNTPFYCSVLLPIDGGT